MKKFLLGSVCALAITGSAYAADYEPPQPHAQADDGLFYTGLIEAWGGWTFAEGDPDNGTVIDDEDHPALGGSARVNIPFSDNFSGQLDFDGEANLLNGDQIDDNYGHSFVGTGHLSLRDPSSHLIGVFGSIGVSSAGEDEQASMFVIGGEGQLYLGNFTLYTQAGFFTSDGEDNAGDDSIEDAVFVRAVGRAFLTPTSRLEVEGTVASGDIDPQGTADDSDPMWAWGARYEQQIGGIGGANMPLAWFIGYRGSYAENQSDNTDYTDHTAMVGLRFLFGAPSLQDNDRRGATLDTPWAIQRWVGYSLESLD